ncbi:MAG: H4MPT-linked C1 transfer pathway protein [Candidatus Bathyarchaeum sp.]|nr:MAG: H4MPT-linked C1 transfer pathway protein [Candidatus Bathyarchaeum sp.]
MVNVLGLDIGGVNTKATFLKTQEGMIKEQRTAIEHFPIWKMGKEKLPQVLEKLKKKLVDSTSLDGVGVTMTAELSDAYWTKKEGVNHILDCAASVFNGVPIFVLSVEAELLSLGDARKEPLKVASANWAATGWMVSQIIKSCLVVDVGSTTTSIIPVINGKIAAEGRTDLEKLQNGELVYSGALRTNVATITDGVPLRGGIVRLSSELFAQSADVHLLLDNIGEEEYTAETCDGRGKTKREAMARLARVVCADIEMLNEQEIMGMAQFVYERQVEQITDGLKQVYERIQPLLLQEKIPVVVTGLGRNFLARKAAEKAGFKEIIDMSEMLGAEASVVSPSVGVALMVASNLEGKPVRWKQL